MKGKSTLILNHETIVEIVQAHLDKVFSENQRQHIKSFKPKKTDQYTMDMEYHIELVNWKEEFENKLKGIQ